jgi:hypothetical protein
MKRFGNINLQLVTYKINYTLVIALIFVFVGMIALAIYALARVFKQPPSPSEPPKRKRLTGPKSPPALAPPAKRGKKGI